MLTRDHPYRLFGVPLGSNEKITAFPENLMSNIPCHHYQNMHSFCVTHAVCSAFHHLGHPSLVKAFEMNKNVFKKMSFEDGFKHMAALLAAPPYGQKFQVDKCNMPRAKKPIVYMDIDEVVQPIGKNEMLIVQPIGHGADKDSKDTSGMRDHIIAVTDNLIFDSRMKMALKLCHQSLDWCTGVHGVSTIGWVLKLKEKPKHKKGGGGKKRKIAQAKSPQERRRRLIPCMTVSK